MSTFSTSAQASLELVSAPPATIGADALVLAAAAAPDAADEESQTRPRLLLEGIDTEGVDVDALSRALEALGYRAGVDEVVRLPAGLVGRVGARTVLVVGTGRDLTRAEDAGRDNAALGATRCGVLARAAGRAVRELAGSDAAVLALPAAGARELDAIAQAAAGAAYAWSARRPASTPPLARIVVASPHATGELVEQSTSRALALAGALRVTRDLVNEPPNVLTPHVLGERAVAAARQEGLDYEVLDEVALAEQGFGGIVGVGQGSAHPPRLIRISWAPEGAPRRVALIGKGITFDSGGLSLKPPASMPEMKSDMAGAATVLGVVLAAARLNLPVRVDAWLAAAENMPSASAQRPSDIVTMYNGSTVEITNTDAEGRLVMADALARAVQDGPDAVLDVATLTGAQIIALGDRVSAVMGTPQLRDSVVECARRAGEAFWPMPLPEHLRSDLDSPVAAMRNAGTASRAGGMLVAGLFLREFVGDTPWAHLDIAGPSFNDKSAWGAVPAGGTGASVACLIEYLTSLT